MEIVPPFRTVLSPLHTRAIVAVSVPNCPHTECCTALTPVSPPRLARPCTAKTCAGQVDKQIKAHRWLPPSNITGRSTRRKGQYLSHEIRTPQGRQTQRNRSNSALSRSTPGILWECRAPYTVGSELPAIKTATLRPAATSIQSGVL